MPSKINFKYIRNRIREYSKDDLLGACYEELNTGSDKRRPIWFIFLLMKWTYLYAGNKYPPKQLTRNRFSKIIEQISNLNIEHATSFIKDKKIDRFFQLISSQQFYLQEPVYNKIFTSQLKLYCSIERKYNLNEAFKGKTGLGIFDFLNISWYLFLSINILKEKGFAFNGVLSKEIQSFLSETFSEDKINKYLHILTLDRVNPKIQIEGYYGNIRNEGLQPLEKTFFTLYPFQVFNDQLRLIHESVFNYTINYYIHDYLRSNDSKFPEEFGDRFERYIELGIKEIAYKYQNESNLKKQLPPGAKIVDFYLESENIFMECKAIELQAYPAVNPTDDLLFNSFKKSILKAYFQQLLSVSKSLNPEGENWAIILTYKRLFWSHFPQLYELGEGKYDEIEDNSHLPPENVFIINIHDWDKVVQIIKDGKATLLEILKTAKSNNSTPQTRKGQFDMHLDIYDLKELVL